MYPIWQSLALVVPDKREHPYFSERLDTHRWRVCKRAPGNHLPWVWHSTRPLPKDLSQLSTYPPRLIVVTIPLGKAPDVLWETLNAAGVSCLITVRGPNQLLRDDAVELYELLAQGLVRNTLMYCG